MISADAIRGYIDVMILAILRREPAYAYEIGKVISQETGGVYDIKQTTLYSAVKRLENSGAISSYKASGDSGKIRTYYQLTSAGLTLLKSKSSEWDITKSVVDHFVKGTL